MNLLCARLKDSFDPTYVEHYFRSPKAKSYIASITKKAVNQASISITDLKRMMIPVPPIVLQQEFAAFVQQVDKSRFASQLATQQMYRWWEILTLFWSTMA